MGKVVAIASGKGGTGKSTVTAFLARALAERGSTALAVEADFGLSALDLVLGVPAPLYHCADVLESRCRISEAAAPVGPLGPWLLPGGSDPDYLPDPNRWAAFLDFCRRCYDFTLIDLPGGLGGFVRQSCAAADLVLAVVTPDQVAVRDCAQLSRVLLQGGTGHQRLLINRVATKAPNPIADLDMVLDRTGIQLMGVVPESPQLRTAAAEGTPLPPGPAQKALAALAARLCGQSCPLVIR